MDSINPHIDEVVRKRLVRLRVHGSFNISTFHYIPSMYMIEDPFFVSSSNTNLVQLADLVAWLHG